MTRQEMLAKATENKRQAESDTNNSMTLEALDKAHAAYCLACNDLESIRLGRLNHVSFNR